MTDDRLLQEILHSPLDDMPERSIDPRRWLVGFGVVIVVGVVGFWLFGGGDETVPAASGTESTVPGDTSGSAAPAGSDGATTTVAVEEAINPEPNSGFHEMVAVDDGEMLVFGGFVSLPDGTPAPFEGTWRFDAVDGVWSVEEPEIAPSPRWGHAMAYHPPTGKVVVFGGGTTIFRPCRGIRICPGPEDNEVWQYDPGTGIWENMTPADTDSVPWPVPRFGSRFVYEPVTGRLVTFGGVGVFGVNDTPNFWNDTWAYDPATNTWEDLSDPDEENRPHPAIEYGLAWNEEAQRVLMFAGDGLSNDDPETLYAFDPATNTWEDIGANEPGEGPKDRWFHDMVADPQSGRTVLFGGNGSIYTIIGGGTTRSNGNLDEVWTWSQAEGWVAMMPLERDFVGAAAAGDPGSLDIIVYGGDQVWSYDAAVDAWSILWSHPDAEDDA